MFHRSAAKGFTIVELLFAMSFLSILLIIAMVSSINIMRTYNKGLVLKQVNQSGRAIGAELQRSLKAAQPPIENATVAEGRLCIGTYSYVWSVGGQDPALYDDNTKVGFAKVSDATRAMCASPTPRVPKDDAIELLGGEVANLAVQSAALSAPVSNNGYYLYSFTFTIGTNDTTLLNDTRDACATAGDQEFCALNRFTITASAKGI
ncbi:MAG TPA: type II secretion system protein [Candidatus Saccharimonadales bacterium]